MKIKIKIRRQDAVGSGRGRAKKNSYLQAYNVEASEGMTILEAMLNITETQDPLPRVSPLVPVFDMRIVRGKRERLSSACLQHAAHTGA